MNKLKNPLTIVANGDFPKHKIPLMILKNSNTIIACDGAANTLIEHTYKPNIIIGDLDSISSENKNKYSNIIIKEIDQSRNDLRKAIDYCLNNNIKKISILGATGKREDHAIGNIFSILKYKDINIKIYTDTGIFSSVHKNKKIASFKGQQVSVFVLDPSIKITSNNLMYNFNKNSISDIYKGTLNESKANSFDISLSHGSLLIFQTYNK
jgi:thiamine pyrophosphokinase